MADSYRGNAGGNLGGARHFHRQRLVAAHAGQLFRQPGRSHLDSNELYRRQRNHDPDYTRKSQAAARRVDYPGIIYLALGLGLLQIVLDRGQRADWFSAWWVCIFVAVAAIALGLLVVRELTFPEPILDLRILAIPLFDISVIIILIMMLVVSGLNLLNPLFFQEMLGYSPWKSGIAVLPRGFGTLAGMFLIG